MPKLNDAPPWDILQAFEAVAKHGSISEAAKSLSLTPSAVSHKINTLEEWLGATLFRRNATGVTMTKNASAYHNKIKTAFDTISTASSNLRTANDDSPLKISVIQSLARTDLGLRLADFEKEFPDIKLNVEFTAALVNFDHDPVDIAIRYGAGHYQDANSEFLMDDYVAPVCHPELATQIKRPEDFLNLHRIHAGGSNPAVVTQWSYWGKHFLPPAKAESLAKGKGAIYDDASYLVQVLKRGQSVGVAKYSIVVDALRTGELVAPLNMWVEAPAAYYLLTSKRRVPRHAAKQFRGWLKQQIADLNYANPLGRATDDLYNLGYRQGYSEGFKNGSRRATEAISSMYETGIREGWAFEGIDDQKN